MSDDEPIKLEAVVAAVGQTFIRKEMVDEARLLAEASVSLAATGEDGWNGGTTIWEVAIRVPFDAYSALTDFQRGEFELRFDEIMGPFVPEIGHWVNSKLHPKMEVDLNWRDSVQGLAKQGTTNQGRAHSKNVASLEHDGLLFRSKPEIHLYNALKATGVPFAPLPVFVRGGRKFSRVEPDFVLIKDGVTIFAEVDGDSYHPESPAEAHYRLKPFQDEGVNVERVKASHCSTPQLAERFAKHLVDLLEKKRGQK